MAGFAVVPEAFEIPLHYFHFVLEECQLFLKRRKIPLIFGGVGFHPRSVFAEFSELSGEIQMIKSLAHVTNLASAVLFRQRGQTVLLKWLHEIIFRRVVIPEPNTDLAILKLKHLFRLMKRNCGRKVRRQPFLISPLPIKGQELAC